MEGLDYAIVLRDGKIDVATLNDDEPHSDFNWVVYERFDFEEEALDFAAGLLDKIPVMHPMESKDIYIRRVRKALE
jgi:hypothetical protein